MLKIEAITQDDARHVLHYFGKEGGWQGGSYTQKLIELLGVADQDNFSKLASVYPGLAAAHYLATTERNGIEILKNISTTTLHGAENVIRAAEAILESGL